jgi:hypothetical protein
MAPGKPVTIFPNRALPLQQRGDGEPDVWLPRPSAVAYAAPDAFGHFDTPVIPRE